MLKFTKKSVRTGLIIFSVVIIIAQLSLFNYSDLSWTSNVGNYLGIIAMICVISIVILSSQKDKSNSKKRSG